MQTFVDEDKPLDQNIIYYDLCNTNRDIIKITRDGWNVEKNYPGILFRRYPLMNPQVEPNRDYPPDILEQLMKLTNVYHDEDNKLLAKVYVISLFLLSDLPKPIMTPYGSKGSGKTTFQEFNKLIVDPSAASYKRISKQLGRISTDTFP